MDDTQDYDFLALDKVYNSVSSEDHFTKIVSIEFRNDAADTGALEEQFHRLNDTIDEGHCMECRIAFAKVFDVLKISSGG